MFNESLGLVQIIFYIDSKNIQLRYANYRSKARINWIEYK
jgi:hypothetical protein